VDDEGPGVAQVTLTIDGGAYGLRKYTWGNLSLVPDDFIWDRHFGEIIAPIGEYPVTVNATDNLGKVGLANGEIVIPDPNPPGGSTGGSIESRSTEGDSSGLLGPAPSLDDLLARLPEGDLTEGPGAPLFAGPATSGSSSASGPSGPERTIAGLSTGETSTADKVVSAPPSTVSPTGTSSGVLWGAAALAAAGAATAYSLARRRAREAQVAAMRREATAAASSKVLQLRPRSLLIRAQAGSARARAAVIAGVSEVGRIARRIVIGKRPLLKESPAPRARPALRSAWLKRTIAVGLVASATALALRSCIAQNRPKLCTAALGPLSGACRCHTGSNARTRHITMSEKSKYQLYLYDLGLLIKEYALQAKARANEKTGEDRAFERGIVFGYMNVMGVIQDEARAFGIGLDELQLDGFDPERELL